MGKESFGPFTARSIKLHWSVRLSATIQKIMNRPRIRSKLTGS